jgi:hypothetical protein
VNAWVTVRLWLRPYLRLECGDRGGTDEDAKRTVIACDFHVHMMTFKWYCIYICSYVYVESNDLSSDINLQILVLFQPCCHILPIPL